MMSFQESYSNYRGKERINLIAGNINRNSDVDFQELVNSAQLLSQIDLNSKEFMSEISNFSSLFKINTLHYIDFLKSMGFDKFLIHLFQENLSPFILQRCLSCVYTWISCNYDKNPIFSSPDFIIHMFHVIFSYKPLDHRSCLLGLAITKTICSSSEEIIKILVENNFIQILVDFYIKCNEIEIQKEILSTLYFIVKSKQVSLTPLTECAKIFSNISNNSSTSNLDRIFALASAFAENNDSCCFIICDSMPLPKLFSSFNNFSNDEQESFLRLLISIFNSSNHQCLSMIVEFFDMQNIIESILSREGYNSIQKEYFCKLLISSFSVSQQIIQDGFNINIFSLLLDWIENEQFSIQKYAFIAVMRSLQYGMNIVGIFLLNKGILNIMITFLGINSFVIINEVCKTGLKMLDFASINGKTKMAQILTDACNPDLLQELSVSDNDISADLIELYKDSLNEIQINQLWN